MTKTRKLKTNPEIELPEHFFKKWVGDRDALVRVRTCDSPDCGQVGEHRAPKSRKNVNEYYWFCIDHVREYNAKWDYYKGLTPLEMEEAMRFSATWERPTWPIGTLRKARKAHHNPNRTFSEEEAEAIHKKAESRGVDPRVKAELNALRELGLLPPVDFETIKARYRTLVKKHHPDVSVSRGVD
jgi:hypothetical protein